MPLAASITPFLRREEGGEKAIEEEKKDQEEGKDELLQGKFFNKPILPLQGQGTGRNKKSELVEAELRIQRGISPAEEDKDQVLQAMRAVSDPPAVQRQIQSDEELDDRQPAIQANFLAESCDSPMRRESATGEEEPETPGAELGGSLAGSFQAGEVVESRLSQSKGQGSPLPDSVRAYMEPRFGVDFSHVRVHTGSNAIQMNRDIGAHAFTHGLDIFFGAGNSPANLELTAHELTHVVQQTGASPLRRRKEKAPIASPPPSSPHSFSPSSIPSDTAESSFDLPIPEIANGSNTGASATAGIGMASPSPRMEAGGFIQDSRTGAVRAGETQQAMSAPALSASTGTREPGKFSEPPVAGTVPSAAPDITNNQSSAKGSEHKAPEAIASSAPVASPAGSGAQKPAEAEPSGMGQITAAPDTALKPHAVAQARLINSDCLQSEAQVARNAATRREQITEHFSGVRQGLASFLTKSIVGVRTLVVAKQSEIVAASVRTLAAIQMSIVSALQSAEAQSNELRDEINGAIEGITASIQERVGGIANQIVDVINVVPLPDLPGVAQIRDAAVNLLRRAAGVVNGAVGQVLGFVRSAFNVGMNLLGSFLRIFRQIIDQALALASSAIQRIMQLIFQALNQLLNLVVSTLESVLSVAVAPLLNRLEALMTQAISNAEQQALAQIRVNKVRHLEVLASAVNPAASGGEAGSAKGRKTASMDDSIAAIREIGLNATQNNRVIIQSFEEQTASITVLIFQRLATAAGQIMQEISARVAQAVEMIVSKVIQVIQGFAQLVQAVVTFIQSLIQALAGGLSRIVQYIRSLVQSPVDQIIEFAQRTLGRMRDFISRLIRNFISSGGSIIASITEIVGDFKPSASFLGPAPAFAGPPIQIIGGFIIILIAGIAYAFPLWVGIVVVVVVLLLLLLLLYLLYRWIFKPPPVKPPPPPPPPPCPLPVNVRNGPFHAPIDEPARVGMEIAITISSSTGVDADMAKILDSEQVSVSFNHTGSCATLPPFPSNNSGFMPGFPIPNDRHASSRSMIIDRADNHGGNGGYDRHQLDIFMAPACGITAPQAIPDSGYQVKRIITVGPGTRITFRVEKSPAACSVNGFSTTAGPSPTQGDDVVVRP
jgi:phage-related protein